jgi:hypothetical protein
MDRLSRVKALALEKGYVLIPRPKTFYLLDAKGAALVSAKSGLTTFRSLKEVEETLNKL